MPLDACPSCIAPSQWAPYICSLPWWWWLKQLSLSEPGTVRLAEVFQPAAWAIAGKGMRYFFYLFSIYLFTSWSGKRNGKFGGLRYIESEGAVQSSQCNVILTQERTIYRALHCCLKELQRKGSVTESWMSTCLGTHSCEGQSEGLSCSVIPLCLALRGRDWWAPDLVVRNFGLWGTAVPFVVAAVVWFCLYGDFYLWCFDLCYFSRNDASVLIDDWLVKGGQARSQQQLWTQRLRF